MLRRIACVALTAFAGLADAQHAHSLGDIPGTLESPEARQAWEREMAGRVQPDLLGETHLAGLDRGAVLAATVPTSERGHVALVGARAWPQQPGRYVAIACVNDDAPRFDHGPRCDGDDLRTYLSVIERTATGVRQVGALGPVFVAPTRRPPELHWSGAAGLDLPQKLEQTEDDSLQGHSLATRDVGPEGWTEFDFARYRVSDGGYAFGLRGGWSEGYAGGGASWSALYLFELRDGALSLVFAAPMSMLKNIAGDWNDDGTRQHDISQAANVLVVMPATHDGYHDLQVRRRGNTAGDTYRWSPTLARYRLSR